MTVIFIDKDSENSHTESHAVSTRPHRRRHQHSIIFDRFIGSVKSAKNRLFAIDKSWAICQTRFQGAIGSTVAIDARQNPARK
jgi:hypothetical protein